MTETAPQLLYPSYTMKLCCRGDQEYMNGIPATVDSGLMAMAWALNPGKPNSTEHIWKKTQKNSHFGEPRAIFLIYGQFLNIITFLLASATLDTDSGMDWILSVDHSELRTVVCCSIFSRLDENRVYKNSRNPNTGLSEWETGTKYFISIQMEDADTTLNLPWPRLLF